MRRILRAFSHYKTVSGVYNRHHMLAYIEIGRRIRNRVRVGSVEMSRSMCPESYGAGVAIIEISGSKGRQLRAEARGEGIQKQGVPKYL